ncbi:MAG: c-type cytochrome [Candidatus Eremiobacteraeota bacterium]|nr:c-type cytochrome [Candidatus Eremiobacteraeota bacterium]
MTSPLRCTLRIAVASLLLCGSVAATPENGAALYALHCSSCHGDDGQGSNVAPSLIGKSASDIHFMLDSGRMPATAPYVNEVHLSPAFTYAQMDAIVRYVQTFSLHSDPSLQVLFPGDASRGRALFAENCAVCHGATGTGDSVGSNNVAPSLGNATVFQVAEAIRSGPGVMPRFGNDELTDRDVSDIARYVNYLQTNDGENAGGFSLAHVGPVAEGFVGWAFGLGLLVLFVRKIGTT